MVLRIKQAIEFQYTLNNVVLQEVESQRDLGVTVSNSLHPRTHITNIIKSANQKIGLIKRCFSSSFSSYKVTVLYKSLIRPVLEYGSPVWAPWHKKDISALESVQSKCLKLCKDQVQLDSLNSRSKIADLIEVYKLLHGYYKTAPNTFFTCPQRALRGHPLKIFKERSRTDLRKHFFSNRVVDAWNSLPEDVVTAPTLNQFKRRLRSLPPDERDSTTK